MSENILDHFEVQIDALIGQFARLKQENSRLRDKQSVLLSEYNAMQEKYTLMTDGVKKMLARLKTIERENESES